MSRKLTIADVAASAEASMATVSRAVKGDLAVRNETREHVMVIARKSWASLRRLASGC